ncbi:MAG: hypothetical protein IIB33_04575 [Chloroflexi bacterium]|nr:hypothetical protein [Chloroflexota bacterium]
MVAKMMRRNPALISVGIAHLLAWVVGLWFVLGPVYQGVTVTLGGTVSYTTRDAATLIEVNGLRVLPLLMTPVALTGLALLTALWTEVGRARRKVLLWVSAVLLLGFCAVSIFSIGLFYLPAALVLMASAIMESRRRARS